MHNSLSLRYISCIDCNLDAAAEGNNNVTVLVVFQLKKVDASIFPGMDLWERAGEEQCLVLDEEIRCKAAPLVVVNIADNLWSVLY